MSTSKDTLEDELDMSPELADELARMVAEPSDELRRFARKCSRLLKSSGGACQHDLVSVLARRLHIREREAEELQRKLAGISRARERERRDARWHKDLAAFQRMQPELKRKHPGKYVAFEDGEVIAVGDTRQVTAGEAHRITGEAKSRIVRHVDDDDYSVREVRVWLGKPRAMERIR